MENNYQFRNSLFTLLCKDLTGGTFADNILNNYQYATIGDDPAYFDLGFSDGVDADGNKVDDTTANYVSGYLAVLYLSDLANMRVNGGGVRGEPSRGRGIHRFKREALLRPQPDPRMAARRRYHPGRCHQLCFSK